MHMMSLVPSVVIVTRRVLQQPDIAAGIRGSRCSAGDWADRRPWADVCTPGRTRPGFPDEVGQRHDLREHRSRQLRRQSERLVCRCRQVGRLEVPQVLEVSDTWVLSVEGGARESRSRRPSGAAASRGPATRAWDQRGTTHESGCARGERQAPVAASTRLSSASLVRATAASEPHHPEQRRGSVLSSSPKKTTTWPASAGWTTRVFERQYGCVTPLPGCSKHRRPPGGGGVQGRSRPLHRIQLHT